MSVVIDGNGKVQAQTSPVYDMNDGDDDVVYPNKWIYPMNNSGGFIDVALELWEDDGDYNNVAKAVAAIGVSIAAISKIPGVGVAGLYAGAALAAIGGLIALTTWLDDDDKYGVESKSWDSDAKLLSGVGPHTASFINYDTGIFDITSFNYELQYELLTS